VIRSSLVAIAILTSAPAWAQSSTSSTTTTASVAARPPPAESPPVRRFQPTPRAEGAPHVVKTYRDERGHLLLVDGVPTMVYGMNWGYMPIGENYSYDFWGKSDDFIREALDAEISLLRKMGINVIRQYIGIPAKWIRYIYEKHGIFTVLNHPIGRYGMNIDGVWVSPVDYSDERMREVIHEEIDALVRKYKDVPGLMMWMLGNENNYGLYWKSTEIEDLPEEQQGDIRAKYLYSLFGEVIDRIHNLDSNHPVVIANGDVGFIDVIAEECKNVDIMGSNVYRGASSRDLFEVIEKKLGVPFMYTEFGSDAFDAKRMREDHLAQAEYLRLQWQEIYEQSYGHGNVGNAIGGMIFQWSDGWWKYKQTENLDVHDETASWATGAYPHDYVEGQNNMNEEWFGIAAKGRNDERGLYEVYPRSAYYLLREAFRLDPYAPSTTNERIREVFGALDPKDFQARYEATQLRSKIDFLERVRLSQLRLDLMTFTTGGKNLNIDEREPRRFDHLQSAYVGIEARPASGVRADATVNVLGNVAVNPIDEIYFERRGIPEEVRNTAGEEVVLTSLERVKLYQASFEWENDWFAVEGYYRKGHYHWGYEGDFFGLYPEANYEQAVDQFNADTPSGVVFTGKKALDGLKIAFGPQLYWGANPTVISKYYRTIGDWEFSLIHQEDIAQQASALTSSIIPQPRTRKSTIYAAREWGPLKLQVGGIMAGTDRLGRRYVSIEEAAEPTYLESGYYVLDDEIELIDTLGAKARVTLNLNPFYWYVQGGYRGLVADAGGDWSLNITNWSMKESGQGNHWAVSSGAAMYLGDFVVAPNFLFQKPLEGPLVQIEDAFDPNTGTYYRGVLPRNQLNDPFWVRSNRETYGFELLLAFDPTPDTFMWAWDNLQRENAFFTAALDFTYKVHPTSQDAAVAVAQEGFVFAFAGAAPARNLWDVSLRTIFNFRSDMQWVNWLYSGRGQANGDDDRLVVRYGTYGRFRWDQFVAQYHVRLHDWGPFDYYRDFNLTFPLQTLLDMSYALQTPDWFAISQTRLGLRGKFRLLDENSGRFQADPDDPDAFGQEWEVLTYVQISI
jgi:beta-galactosidase